MSTKSDAWFRNMASENNSLWRFCGMKLNPLTNDHLSPMARCGRTKRERNTGYLIGKAMGVKAPVTVTFTRYSVGVIDDDNLPACFKAIRDGIADAAGVDDGPNGGITWRYQQEKVSRGCYGFSVELSAAF